MPIYTAKLNDGTTVELESDSPPSEEDILAAIPKPAKLPEVSAPRTFFEHAATGVVPGAGFMAAFPTGARIGAGIGALVPGAGETGISEAIGAGIGGLVTGSIAAWAAHKAQQKVLQKVAPEFEQRLETEMAAGERQHPVAASLGEIASLGPSAKMAPFKLAQIPLRAAIGAGVSAGMPLLHGEKPTVRDVLTGAAMATIYGEARWKKPTTLQQYIDTLRPAVKTMDGTLYPGKRGDTHNDIIDRMKISADDLDRRTFIDANGKEAPRQLVARLIGTERPGEAHSTDLNVAQERIEDASRKREAETVYGDVQAQPGEGAREVPAKEGGGRILTPAEAQETEVLLRPHLEENRTQGLGSTVRILDAFPNDPEHLRIARAHPPEVDAEGNFVRPGIIDISKAALERHLADTPEALRPEVLRTNIAEEGIHSIITPDEARAYADTLTSAEKKLGTRLYLGKLKAEQVGLTPTWQAHELLRQRMQQLMRLDTTEASEVSGLERWSRESLQAISNIIRRIREFIGTKAATAGRELTERLLNRADANIRAIMEKAPARAAEAPAEAPAAIRRAGTTSVEEMDRMSNAEAVKFFNDLRAAGIPPQHDSPLAGAKLGPEDVPRLQALRDKAGKDMLAAIRAGDRDAQVANFGKNIWYSGAIEGARREGPNYAEAIAREGVAEPVTAVGAALRGEPVAEPEVLRPGAVPELRVDTPSGPMLVRENASVENPVGAGSGTSADIARDQAFAQSIRRDYRRKLREEIAIGSANAPLYEAALAIQDRLDQNKLFWRLNDEMSWLQKNGDYWKSVDPDALCQKSEGVDASVNYLKQVLGDKYESSLAWEVIARANAEKLKTPCPQCYVFSHRAAGAMAKVYMVGVAGYNGEVMRFADSQVEDLTNRALRHYSSTDFKAEHIPGLIIETIQLSERGLPAGAYSKDPDFPRVFGPARYHINMSVGRDDVIGMPMAEALALREQYPTIGTVYVGFNDAEILSIIGRDNIDHVIPWHGSAQAVSELAGKLGMDPSEILNYEKYKYKGVTANYQRDTINGKMAERQLRDADHGGDMDRYLYLIEKAGMTPRFPQLLDALRAEGRPELYMKLIGPEYGKHGGPYPYEPVQPVFDFAAVDVALKNRLKNRLASSRDYIRIAQGIAKEVNDGTFVRGPVEPLIQTGAIQPEPPAAIRRPAAEVPEYFQPGELAGAMRRVEDQLPAGVRRPQPKRFRKITDEALTKSSDEIVQATKTDLTRQYLTNPEKLLKVPTFEAFAGEMRKRFGELPTGALVDQWERSVWDTVMKASGKELEALRSALTLRTKVGSREVADPPPEKRTPEPEAIGREAKLLAADKRKALAAAQKYRRTVQGAIGEKMITQAVESFRPALRTTVTPDDLGTRRKSKQPVYYEVTPKELEDINALGNKLTDDAGQNKLKRSITKRLTVIENPTTKEVAVVSTFRDPRRGPVLLDPNSPEKTHLPLADLVTRWKPIHSIFLDEPVERFLQRFPDRETYETKLGKPIEKMRQAWEEPVTEGAQPAPSIVDPHRPLMPEEAAGIMDHLVMETGKVETIDDVRDAIAGLKDATESGRMDIEKWRAINGLLKVNDALAKRWPVLTEDQVFDQMVDEIHDKAIKSTDLNDFVSKVMGDYAPEYAEDLQRYQARQAEAAEPGAIPSETARELETPGRARPIPVGRPAYRFPPTFPEPTRPPARLTPVEQTAVMAEALRKHPPAARPLPEMEPAGGSELEPAGLRRAAAIARDEIENIGNNMAAIMRSAEVTQRISAGLDSANSSSNNLAREGEVEIRLESVQRPAGAVVSRLRGAWRQGNKNVLAAANVLVESGFDQNKIRDFKAMVAQGRTTAESWENSTSWRRRREGRAWLRALDEADRELDYAQAHWNDPELQATARRAQQILDEALDRERAAGMDINRDPNYMPHRYTMMYRSGVMGKRYKLPQTFETYYAALSKGPYLAVTRDAASLVGHRVRQGLEVINENLWKESLKSIIYDGRPMAIEPVMKDHRWVSPDIHYTLVAQGGGVKPLAVQNEFETLFNRLTSHSFINDWDMTRAALHFSQRLKHTLLLGDFFHLARVTYYGASILRQNLGFRGGWTVLDIPERAIPLAVRKGLIRQADADWGAQRLTFTDPAGRTTTMTRRELAKKFYSEMGANLGKIQDALYKELVTNLTPRSGALARGIVKVGEPTIGRYNRFLFDTLTRGLMTESAVREFERQSAKLTTTVAQFDPVTRTTRQQTRMKVDPERLMRDIAKDVNVFFGNIGRQGFLKAKWEQDLARMFFLAPQWVEGLLRKEMTAYSRLTGVTSLMGGRRGLAYAGTTGRGIATGMVFLFGLTQALNYLNRGHSTFQNPEDGHKFDAYIPGAGADNRGFWMSPLAIYNELTHDVYRLLNSKPHFMQVFGQIMGNKESPLVRAALVMKTGQGPTGEIQTTGMGTLKAAAEQLLPVPITFGKYGQQALHLAAPNLVKKVPAAQLERQAFGTIGVKVEPMATPSQRIAEMAKKFMKDEGLDKETGWQEVMNDEASYSKLRASIRIEDFAGAKKIYNRLLKGRSEAEILKSMKIWAKRGFTGSAKTEKLFIDSLDDEQMNEYSNALDQKLELYDKFLDFYNDL